MSYYQCCHLVLGDRLLLERCHLSPEGDIAEGQPSSPGDMGTQRSPSQGGGGQEEKVSPSPHEDYWPSTRLIGSSILPRGRNKPGNEMQRHLGCCDRQYDVIKSPKTKTVLVFFQVSNLKPYLGAT